MHNSERIYKNTVDFKQDDSKSAIILILLASSSAIHFPPSFIINRK